MSLHILARFEDAKDYSCWFGSKLLLHNKERRRSICMLKREWNKKLMHILDDNPSIDGMKCVVIRVLLGLER